MKSHNSKGYQVSGTGVQAWLLMSAGQHDVVVQACNSTRVTYKSAVTINVPGVPIAISSPAVNAAVNSPVTGSLGSM